MAFRVATALVALASAAAHVLALVGGATTSPASSLVLVGMAMACLPCALHLVLVRRYRSWLQTAAVSVAILVAYPFVVGGHGAGHHGSSGALTVAMTAVPAAALVLALSGMVLDGRRCGALRADEAVSTARYLGRRPPRPDPGAPSGASDTCRPGWSSARPASG